MSVLLREFFPGGYDRYVETVNMLDVLKDQTNTAINAAKQNIDIPGIDIALIQALFGNIRSHSRMMCTKI